MSTQWVYGEDLTYPRATLTFHWPSDVLMTGVAEVSKAPGEPLAALHYTDGSIEVGEYKPELTEEDTVFKLVSAIQSQREE